MYKNLIIFLCLILNVEIYTVESLISPLLKPYRPLDSFINSTLLNSYGSLTLSFISPYIQSYRHQDSFTLYALRTCEKLKRPHSARRALLRALTTQVLRHGRIITTVNKARQTKPRVERIIKYSKKENVRHARLLINSYLYDRKLTENVLQMAPIRFKERHGGYCRIRRLTQCNQGDNSNRAILELLEY